MSVTAAARIASRRRVATPVFTALLQPPPLPSAAAPQPLRQVPSSPGPKMLAWIAAHSAVVLRTCAVVSEREALSRHAAIESSMQEYTIHAGHRLPLTSSSGRLRPPLLRMLSQYL